MECFPDFDSYSTLPLGDDSNVFDIPRHRPPLDLCPAPDNHLSMSLIIALFTHSRECLNVSFSLQRSLVSSVCCPILALSLCDAISRQDICRLVLHSLSLSQILFQTFLAQTLRSEH
jgi:hypothetical protein